MRHAISQHVKHAYLIVINRPFQGKRRHIAEGAKTLGRARGHPWRPLYFLMSERKLHVGICFIFSQNIGGFH